MRSRHVSNSATGPGHLGHYSFCGLHACRCKLTDTNGKKCKCIKYVDTISADAVRIGNVQLTETGLLGARGHINSKSELIGILKALPGGEANVPPKWRAFAPANGKRPATHASAGGARKSTRK